MIFGVPPVHCKQPARPAWNCRGPGHSRPRNREVARKILSPAPMSWVSGPETSCIKGTMFVMCLKFDRYSNREICKSGGPEKPARGTNPPNQCVTRPTESPVCGPILGETMDSLEAWQLGESWEGGRFSPSVHPLGFPCRATAWCHRKLNRSYRLTRVTM